VKVIPSVNFMGSAGPSFALQHNNLDPSVPWDTSLCLFNLSSNTFVAGYLEKQTTGESYGDAFTVFFSSSASNVTNHAQA
jgi:hypothetical protein